jgi:hypothetical protein
MSGIDNDAFGTNAKEVGSERAFGRNGLDLDLVRDELLTIPTLRLKSQ